MSDFREKEQIKIGIQGEGTFSLEKGENVLSVLIEQGLFETAHCAGHGTCGKCAVRFISQAPLPKPADRRHFTPEQLREGWRLACMAKPQRNCEIAKLRLWEAEFVLDKALIGDLNEVKESPAKSGETIALVDLGTTTIALLLVEKQTGKIVETSKRCNPQRAFGADVIRRIEWGLSGKKLLLSEMVKEVLEKSMEEWFGEGHFPQEIVLAGNTVMIHLFKGLSVEGIAKAPFVPVTTGSVPFEILGVKGVTVPGISAFVGGDIVAGMLACKKEMEKDGIKNALLIDLGTNGEMVLFTEQQNYCTATAAGPAFEGGYGDNVWAADVILAVSSLMESGIIDETGLLAEEYFDSGVYKGGLLLRQENIRKLQEAKAAVFAGIRILLEEAGMTEEEVERVYLAGGFGYKLNVDAACKIGLMPSMWHDRTISAGNTALAGAYLYARGVQADDMIKHTKSINLAEKEHFNAYYLQAMNLREERDFS